MATPFRGALDMDAQMAAGCFYGAGFVMLAWGIECICPFGNNRFERKLTGIILTALAVVLLLVGMIDPMPHQSPVRPAGASVGLPTSQPSTSLPSVSRKG